MKFNLQFIFALLALTSAKADQFSFSYTFQDGQNVSGSFSGDVTAQGVTNAANFSVQFNGQPAPSINPDGDQIFSAAYQPGTGYVPGAVFSSVETQNNFEVGNADFAGGDFGGSWYFILGLNESNLFVANLGFAPWAVPEGMSSEGELAGPAWSLTDLSTDSVLTTLDQVGSVSDPVPDSAWTGWLLAGSVLVLLAGASRFGSRTLAGHTSPPARE